MLARILPPIVLLSSLFHASAARADQCELVDADTATWATKLLHSGVTFAKFCESCGDTVIGKPMTVTSVSAKAIAGGKKSVVLNSKAVDLASTYVQTGKTTWANAATLVGCPVVGATAVFTVSPVMPAPKVVTGSMGVMCDKYFSAIDNLQQCKQFPKTAFDALHEAMAQAKKTMQGAGADARAEMQQGCAAGLDAIRQSAKSMNCLI